MRKVVRDGEVAVLISTDWGSGWYTANPDCTDCLFDPDIVHLVETLDLSEFVNVERICELAESKWGTADRYFSTWGAGSLEIVWLPEGTRFLVREYDGREWIETMADLEWLQA